MKKTILIVIVLLIGLSNSTKSVAQSFNNISFIHDFSSFKLKFRADGISIIQDSKYFKNEIDQENYNKKEDGFNENKKSKKKKLAVFEPKSDLPLFLTCIVLWLIIIVVFWVSVTYFDVNLWVLLDHYWDDSDNFY